jgi:probable phosphoglycerate mutase
MTPLRRTRKPLPRSAARLFDEPTSRDSASAWLANVDGASRGNPGPASYGVLIRRPDGSEVLRLKKYLGVTTNNVAEYYALLTALDYAISHGVARLRVRSDSELLVRQMQGHYKVKSASLKPLYEQARKLAAQLAYFSIEHVPRELNAEADRLANEALDETGGGRGEARNSKSETRDRASANSPKRVRARYSAGALHPAEPLDLAEGEAVELTIHPRRG